MIPNHDLALPNAAAQFRALSKCFIVAPVSLPVAMKQDFELAMRSVRMR